MTACAYLQNAAICVTPLALFGLAPFSQVVVDLMCDRVTPLVRNRGRVVVTTQIIYFQPFNNIESEPVSKFKCVVNSSGGRAAYSLTYVGLSSRPHCLLGLPPIPLLPPQKKPTPRY